MAGANAYQVPARDNGGNGTITEMGSRQAALADAKDLRSISLYKVSISFENEVAQRWDRTLYAAENRWHKVVFGPLRERLARAGRAVAWCKSQGLVNVDTVAFFCYRSIQSRR